MICKNFDIMITGIRVQTAIIFHKNLTPSLVHVWFESGGNRAREDIKKMDYTDHFQQF